MTNNQEKSLLISDALGYLDDDILAEAHPETVGRPPDAHRKERMWKNMGLVASLALLLLISPILFRMGIDIVGSSGGSSGDMVPPNENMAPNAPMEDNENKNDGHYGADVGGSLSPKPDAYPVVGDVVLGDFGRLHFASETETTITLRMTLTKKATVPLYIYFFDYSGVMATTQPNYQNGGVIIREGRIKVTVNGQAWDGALPSDIGTYDIVLDISSLLKDHVPMQDRFHITSFPDLHRTSSKDN